MNEARTTFTARRPVDLVAVVPFLLGFHPEDSVVLLTFGAGDTFHARVDLPGDEDDQAAVVDMLADVLAQHSVRRVALLIYTDDTWVAATFHDAALVRLLPDGVEVIDILRVGRDRFHDAGDPDDPGTAYDLKEHVFTAEQVLEGTVVHSNRAALASSLEVVDPADAHAVAAAAGRAADAGLAGNPSAEELADELAEQARWVQRTVRGHVANGTTPTADAAGRLLRLVSLVDIRDVAWAEMTRPSASRHVDLWRDLVRRCPDDLLPAAASLLAFAAWLGGQGALAWCALDRCAAVDPAYSMAECVGGLLERAVPPSVWTPIAESELRVLWPAQDLEAS